MISEELDTLLYQSDKGDPTPSEEWMGGGMWGEVGMVRKGKGGV